MIVLVVEDDLLIAELIQSVILSLNPVTKTVCATNSQDAIDSYFKEKPDLVLCDWQLGGMDTSQPLLQQIHQSGDRAQTLIITAHATRDLVMQGRRLGVSQFLVKPFSPEALASRLQPFLATETDKEDSTTTSVRDWLTQQLKRAERLPNLADTNDLIGQLQGSNELSPQDIAAKCHKHVNLTERLIRVANNTQMRRSGRPIGTLPEAIAIIGVDMAVAQIIAVTLAQTGEAINDPCVARCAQQLNERSIQLAELSAKLAHAAKADTRLCFTAGLLAFIGDLAVLGALDLYSREQVSLTDSATEEALDEFAPLYGNHLKQHWRVPMKLRQTIGAAHKLPSLSCDKNQIIMNLAAGISSEPANKAHLLKLAHLAGLPEQLVLDAATDCGSGGNNR